MVDTEINTGINEEAFTDIVASFELTDFQATLLYEIISDNLDKILNSQFLELIKNNPSGTLPQALWLEELILEIKNFNLYSVEEPAIPDLTAIILAYIAVAHLGVEL